LEEGSLFLARKREILRVCIFFVFWGCFCAFWGVFVLLVFFSSFPARQHDVFPFLFSNARHTETMLFKSPSQIGIGMGIGA